MAKLTIREKEEKRNGGALCNYYGSLDTSIKPKYGVVYFMLDEYIERTMEFQREKAKEDLHKINKIFKSSLEDELKASRMLNEKLEFQVKELSRLIKDIVNINKLTMPKKLEIKSK